jgi:hypothetical protein
MGEEEERSVLGVMMRACLRIRRASALVGRRRPRGEEGRGRATK